VGFLRLAPEPFTVAAASRPTPTAPASLVRRTALVAAVATAVVGAVALAVALADVLVLVFAGLLFAILLATIADAVAGRTGWPRGVALALTLLGLLIVTVGGALLLWPSVSAQVDELSTQLPAALGELRAWLEARAWGRWLLGQGTSGTAMPSGVVTRATMALASSVTAIGSLVVVFFVGLYGAAQPRVYRDGALQLVPRRRRAEAGTLIDEVVSTLRWWLFGTMLSMTVVGVLTTVGLWVLGVPLALTFGLLAAALTFIPNLGPVIAVVPPAVLTLAEAPTRALQVGALYFAVQLVESYAITPLIQRHTVSLPPALTIVAQVAMGVLLGIPGVAVATPLTAAILTVFRTVTELDDRAGARSTV
jgi:predicted PurR-regulated permease PerM